MTRTKLILAAALVALAPNAASAQSGGAVDTSYGNPQPQEERGFPWGLLGLLGLAGLLGRKRHDRTHADTTRPRV
jgi:MYXO-CTERM domain-containing protein